MSTTSHRTALTFSWRLDGVTQRNATPSVVQNMFQVEDYRWLTSQIAQPYWLELLQNTTSKTGSLLKGLRSHLPANYASILLEQFELQVLAKRKVPDPQRWFWTRQLLEQSSDSETALETALDFPLDGLVIDVCCGAGADAIALANRGLSVSAIDRCSIACELTRHNARSQGLVFEVLNVAAEVAEVEMGSFIHIDPDRRAEGTRTSSLEKLSPTWETIMRLLKRCRGMSLKLAPGTRSDYNGLKHHVDRPPQAIRFLSRDGSVRQQRWYWGLARWPEQSITASMHLNEPSSRRALQFATGHEDSLEPSESTSGKTKMFKDWFHETFQYSDLARSDATVTVKPSDFVADYDPSIRAADLSWCFANRYGCQLIDSKNGYFTASQPSIHPMVRWFKVVDILPLDSKRMKSYAKDARVQTWELKSRGLDVDLNALRKILSCDCKSSKKMTILCTQLGNSHRAIFCTECD